MSGRLARAAALTTTPADVGPEWGALSAELSELAFRYAEGVGVRCWPKASAPAPGCCYLESGTILLDGELIREPAALGEIVAPPALRADLAVLAGVLLHECGHANHSRLEVNARAHEEGVAEEAKLLEEPRMETRFCDRHPIAKRFVRAAVRRINVEHLPEPGTPLTRAHAAHIGVVLGGRERAGTLPEELRERVWALVEAGVGADDATKLGELVPRACEIADGDAEAMVAAARELRELVGADSEAALPEALAGALRELIEATLEAAGAKAAGAIAGEGDGELEDGELAEAREALERLAGRVRDEVSEAKEREERRRNRGHGRGRGAGFGARPGSPPGPAERAAARAMERELRRVKARRTAREGSRVPGRFAARRAMRVEADRARGVVRLPEPYVRRVEVKASLWAPEVAVAIDTSGSMAVHCDELARVVWVAAKAIRAIGGRLAVLGFGDRGEVILAAGDRLASVPEFSCRGGTERFDLAAALIWTELRFSDRRRPRLLVIVSDGVWVSHADASEAELRRIREAGVATVHVGIGGPPVEHGAARAGSIPDPAALGEILGEECRAALERRA
ncbi:MAG: hypothetical protein GEU88_05315 [Solirubrobacterales bacterium]|nr:hypothetical protein [Solirubrobacterales bacterium]